MEMDSAQYWESVRRDARSGRLGIGCLECSYERDVVVNNKDQLTLVNEKIQSYKNKNRTFHFVCPKCGGDRRFYLKEKRRGK